MGSQVLSFRVTDALAAILETEAKRKGITRSQYAYSVVLRHALRIARRQAEREEIAK